MKKNAEAAAATRPAIDPKESILFQALALGFTQASFPPAQADALAYVEFRSLTDPNAYSRRAN